MIHVTTHAVQRFIERVRPCSIGQAREHILSHSKAIEAAAAFGCEVIRCGRGERLVLDGTTVVTVYQRGDFPHQCRNPFNQEAR